MSLIPPTVLIMSKLKYHIIKRLGNSPSFLESLGPYPEFELRANFRSLENGTCNELEDYEDYIQSSTTRWDCIDTALNMFTRMKTFLKENMRSPGVLRLAIVSREEKAKLGTPWSDMFVDEFPLNIRGIRDEHGKELCSTDEPVSASSSSSLPIPIPAGGRQPVSLHRHLHDAGYLSSESCSAEECLRA